MIPEQKFFWLVPIIMTDVSGVTKKVEAIDPIGRLYARRLLGRFDWSLQLSQALTCVELPSPNLRRALVCSHSIGVVLKHLLAWLGCPRDYPNRVMGSVIRGSRGI